MQKVEAKRLKSWFLIVCSKKDPGRVPVAHVCNPIYSIRRIEVQGQPRQIVWETLISKKTPSHT
jgi:hypothetical protein